MATQLIRLSSPRVFKPINQVEREPLSDTHETVMSLLKKNAKLRENSIQFMASACAKFKFKKDTLFLSIKIMDVLI